MKRLHHNSQSGATIVEFSIVAMLFIFFVFSIIDMARYMYTVAILDKAAQNTLNYGQKVYGLDKDTRNYNIGSDEHTKFVAAYNAALQRGQRLLDVGPLVPSTMGAQGAKPWLAAIQLIVPFANGNETFDSDIILLRPGDSARITHQDGTVEWIDHPDYCSASSPNAAGADPCTTLPANVDYNDILKTAPFQVELRAAFFPTLSFLPFRVKATGRAIGVRELVVESGVPISQIPTASYTTTTLPPHSSSSSPGSSSSGSSESSSSESSSSEGSSSSSSSSTPNTPAPPIYSPPGPGGGGGVGGGGFSFGG